MTRPRHSSTCGRPWCYPWDTGFEDVQSATVMGSWRFQLRFQRKDIGVRDLQEVVVLVITSLTHCSKLLRRVATKFNILYEDFSQQVF
jgi:hypothetical protein